MTFMCFGYCVHIFTVIICLFLIYLVFIVIKYIFAKIYTKYFYKTKEEKLIIIIDNYEKQIKEMINNNANDEDIIDVFNKIDYVINDNYVMLIDHNNTNVLNDIKQMMIKNKEKELKDLMIINIKNNENITKDIIKNELEIFNTNLNTYKFNMDSKFLSINRKIENKLKKHNDELKLNNYMKEQEMSLIRARNEEERQINNIISLL
jgi:hypothetical protein